MVSTFCWASVLMGELSVPRSPVFRRGSFPNMSGIGRSLMTRNLAKGCPCRRTLTKLLSRVVIGTFRLRYSARLKGPQKVEEREHVLSENDHSVLFSWEIHADDFFSRISSFISENNSFQVPLVRRRKPLKCRKLSYVHAGKTATFLR